MHQLYHRRIFKNFDEPPVSLPQAAQQYRGQQNYVAADVPQIPAITTSTTAAAAATTTTSDVERHQQQQPDQLEQPKKSKTPAAAPAATTTTTTTTTAATTTSAATNAPSYLKPLQPRIPEANLVQESTDLSVFSTPQRTRSRSTPTNEELHRLDLMDDRSGSQAPICGNF
eukprot:TRINITY_DN5268_c0_g1_i1.p1 TRINITY_DN5268_c0_g1~~TRINITY_DN5268_c0_g1_i1.p1  ORF type:complete len:171 (-),score=23.61 TRINITY_DN5268_c0_g1_i1:92-604(-)